ncbi:MAG: GNAT family N-acetyltransferase [Clostridiales bacterium]|nr:GNAT family N-acetyltransferase [Clostridiales bacterium]
MDIKIEPLRKKDFDVAREFASVGMHLDWYTRSDRELYVYSRYYFYYELIKATRAFGAYSGDTLVGFLLADMNDQPKLFKSLGYRLFVNLVTFIIDRFYKDGSIPYDEANKEMLDAYKVNNHTDGELSFFAVDPKISGKGIGTLLLNELTSLEKGKHIYLFTDSGCTYPFYPRRGFDEVGRKDTTLKNKEKAVQLTCFMFSKTL